MSQTNKAEKYGDGVEIVNDFNELRPVKIRETSKHPPG